MPGSGAVQEAAFKEQMAKMSPELRAEIEALEALSQELEAEGRGGRPTIPEPRKRK